MATVHPFKAVRPSADAVEQVASPPYDVMSADEAREMSQNNPLSFLRVIRSEIDLPVDTDPYADEVYQKAVENYQHIKENAPFVQDETPHYYIYALEMNGHRQTGIAACPAVDDYDNDVIKKHEKTREAKENDRTRHITELRAQTGLVFLTYRDSKSIDQLVESVTASETPLYDFTADDGIRHTIWQMPANLNDDMYQAFQAIPTLYIADGHHRAASASRTRAAFQQANPNHTGNEDYNRFLNVIFPESQLQILPYNRVVKDLAGHSETELMDKLKENFDISETDNPSPQKPKTVCMYLSKKWYLLSYKGDINKLSPVDQLDVSILQDFVLSPLLNIQDPRKDNRIDFVGGIRGTGELEKLVDSGKAAVAFSMYPTTVQDLMNISDANETMPPKSTWFEPKLRDGMLVHEI
jgi:uncharacterized protein (DUF1015 family)